MITSKRQSGFNKKDLTEQLALRADIPKSTAAKTINLITSIISDALVDGKKVTISDFGTFNLSERNAFEGYDPQNDRRIQVPPRVIPVFRAGKKLKQSLNVLNIRDCIRIGRRELTLTFNHLGPESIAACQDQSNYQISYIDGTTATPTGIRTSDLEGETPTATLTFTHPIKLIGFTITARLPHIDLSNTITTNPVSFEVA